MKTIVVVAVAVLALQVLSVRADSAEDLSDNLLALSRLDVADKAGLALAPQFSNQLVDVTGILRALQNVLNNIRAQIQSSAQAAADAINRLLQSASNAATSTINSWNNGLQDLINGAKEVNADVQKCEAEQESLQDVGDALTADVQACVQQASVSIQNTLNQLQDLEPQAQALIDAVAQDINDCAPQGLLWREICLAGRVLPRVQQGGLLAANATRLSAVVAADLVIRVPAQSGACVASATGSRGVEAARVIASISRCVHDSLRNSTTTTTTTTTTSTTTTAVPTSAPTAPPTTSAPTTLNP